MKCLLVPCLDRTIKSPSLRRVWVEIYRIKAGDEYDDVTLLAEGVG